MKVGALWRNFPVVYVLPFLLSTIEVESVAAFSESARWMMMVFAVMFFLVQKPPFGIRLLRRPTISDLLMIGFLALFAASASWSIDGNYSFQRAMSLVLLYAATMWAFWCYADRYSEEFLLRKVLLAISIVLLLNLVLAPFFPSAFMRGRFVGIFVNPNNIGLLAGLAVPLAFSLWLRSHRKLYLLAFLTPLVSLFAAGTRSALVGIGIAMTLIVLANFGRKPVRSFFVAMLVSAGIVMFTQTDYFVENVLRAESLATASNRIYFWELAKGYIANRPMAGHGFGTDLVIHQWYGRNLAALGLRGYGATSSYYGMAIQMGWVVTVVFFGLIWLFALRCVLFHWQNLPVVAVGATIISGLVICVFEPAIYSAGNAFAFLFWMCVMLALRRLHYAKKGIVLDTWGRIESIPQRPRKPAPFTSTARG